MVKRVPAGEGISYGLRHAPTATTTVATVPIGYADGVPRRLGLAGGEVLVGGVRRPIVGVVTMDQLMVDCGDDHVEVGDEVVLIGRQGDEEITAEEWAGLLDTIAYEIVCGIGPACPASTARPDRYRRRAPAGVALGSASADAAPRWRLLGAGRRGNEQVIADTIALPCRSRSRRPRPTRSPPRCPGLHRLSRLLRSYLPPGSAPAGRAVARRWQDRRMRVLLVEPYLGGSHADWATGLARHSTHEVGGRAPGRHWRWRMRGGPVTLAEQAAAEVAEPAGPTWCWCRAHRPGRVLRLSRRWLGDTRSPSTSTRASCCTRARPRVGRRRGGVRQLAVDGGGRPRLRGVGVPPS